LGVGGRKRKKKKVKEKERSPSSEVDKLKGRNIV
jgi:hypothetical protein